MKIGIFGGSFDPVHNGHIAAAKAARETAGLSAVFFVPAFVSPLKVGQMNAGGSHRLSMIRLAIAEEPTFQFSDYELRRPGGASFTIDTIRYFVKKNPKDSISFIMGADSLATFPHWKNVYEILRLCEIIVIARPGNEIGELMPGGKFTIVRDFTHPASSTEIRRRFAAGEAVGPELIHPEVADFIRIRKLYNSISANQTV